MGEPEAGDTAVHRVPIKQAHFRSGWLWWTLGSMVTVAGVVVWVTLPGPASCDTTHTVGENLTVDRIPMATSSSGFAAWYPQDPPDPGGSGEARYYAFGQGVACSFPRLPVDGFYAGMSTQEYGNADLCGAYLDVHGPRGDVRVLIADRCPGCAPGQLDLSAAAFEQIAERSDGVAQVGYAVVRDPDPAPELFYEVKPDSSAQWLAILVSGSGNPLQRVAIRPATGGGWQELNHGTDNYWTISGAGPGPFSARVIDMYGHQVEVSGISLEPGQRFTGMRLYSAAPSTAPVAAAPAPTTRTGQTTGRAWGCQT
ncbi:expansin EXLX1 family cellulose-binding protein [Nocardia sp. NPDC051463]|uniref:expansin EXLX1 family cellulose-binding protein n=1 Tax=Nocardia sp. NPDC051463 TaxID=3154845 RepID=UPI003438D803